MPRDEPVGSFGRLALKPTEFREQLGLIGFCLRHVLPPDFDDSGCEPLQWGAKIASSRDGIESRCCGKRSFQPLLPIARLNV